MSKIKQKKQEKENNPKVLVASPTYKGMKYCDKEFFNAIKNLTYPLYDILIIENSTDDKYFNELKKQENIILIKDDVKKENKMLRLISSRNKIIDYVLKNNYDYVLIMDCDVIPPKNIIEELIKCNKDIVSGIYFNYFKTLDNKTKWLPVAWVSISKKEFENFENKQNLPDSVESNLDLRGYLTKQEVESNELLKVLIPSAGCLLVKNRVLQNPKIRYGLLETKKHGNIHTTDDVYFITKAREAGFDAYCYTKIKCQHLIKGKFNINEKGEYEHPLYEDYKDNEENNKKTSNSIIITYELD